MRHLGILLFLVAGLASVNSAMAQNTPQTVIKPSNERVVLFTDKDSYVPGDTIIFKGYVADTTNAPVSRYLYVELLNQSIDARGKVVKGFTPKVIEWAKVLESRGSYNGFLIVPESLSKGTYIIRAYTRAQKDAPGQLLYNKKVLIDAVPKVNGPVDYNRQIEDAVASAGEIWKVMEKSDFAPGTREMSSKVHFSVLTSKKKLPKEFDVAVVSYELGISLSYHIKDGKIVNPNDYENVCLEMENEREALPSRCDFALSVPDFYDGASFVVNVTGSFYIYPAGGGVEFAPYYDYASASDSNSPLPLENYRKYNDSRVKDADDYDVSDTLEALVIAADSKPGFYVIKGGMWPFPAIEGRNVRIRDEMRKFDDMDLLSYIVQSYPGLMLRTGEHGRYIATYRMISAIEWNRMPLLFVNGVFCAWDKVSNLKVSEVDKLFILKDADAALYRADLVLYVQLREPGTYNRSTRAHNSTVVLKPMGLKNLLLLE